MTAHEQPDAKIWYVASFGGVPYKFEIPFKSLSYFIIRKGENKKETRWLKTNLQQTGKMWSSLIKIRSQKSFDDQYT